MQGSGCRLSNKISQDAVKPCIQNVGVWLITIYKTSTCRVFHALHRSMQWQEWRWQIPNHTRYPILIGHQYETQGKLIKLTHTYTYPHVFAISKKQKQGKSEGFDSCDRPSNLKLDSNRQFFRLCDREIWWMTSKNNRALLLYYVKLCASL